MHVLRPCCSAAQPQLTDTKGEPERMTSSETERGEGAVMRKQEFRGGSSTHRGPAGERGGCFRRREEACAAEGWPAGRREWDVDERPAGAKSHGTTEMAPVSEAELSQI